MFVRLTFDNISVLDAESLLKSVSLIEVGRKGENGILTFPDSPVTFYSSESPANRRKARRQPTTGRSRTRVRDRHAA